MPYLIGLKAIKGDPAQDSTAAKCLSMAAGMLNPKRGLRKSEQDKNTMANAEWRGALSGRCNML